MQLWRQSSWLTEGEVDRLLLSRYSFFFLSLKKQKTNNMVFVITVMIKVG